MRIPAFANLAEERLFFFSRHGFSPYNRAAIVLGVTAKELFPAYNATEKKENSRTKVRETNTGTPVFIQLHCHGIVTGWINHHALYAKVMPQLLVSLKPARRKEKHMLSDVKCRADKIKLPFAWIGNDKYALLERVEAEFMKLVP